MLPAISVAALDKAGPAEDSAAKKPLPSDVGCAPIISAPAAASLK